MLSIINESILDQKVDAIVNPANSFLRHGGGLARIIADAATWWPNLEQRIRPDHGYDFDVMRAKSRAWAKAHADAPNIPTGGALLTSAGQLPFKAIIHAVGPIWGGGEMYEADLLGMAYASACEIAAAQEFQSIAFPAISMGIFGVPRDVVAEEAYWGTIPLARIGVDVRICLTNDEDRDAFREVAEDAHKGEDDALLGWEVTR